MSVCVVCLTQCQMQIIILFGKREIVCVTTALVLYVIESVLTQRLFFFIFFYRKVFSREKGREVSRKVKREFSRKTGFHISVMVQLSDLDGVGGGYFSGKI